MKLQIVKGTTNKRVRIFIQDSSVTDGSGLDGLVFNSAGLTWYYSRDDDGDAGGNAVTIVTATRGTYTSGGFVEKDATNMPGVYEIGIPDAALASGSDSVEMILQGASNMAPVPIEIQLTDVDLHDGARGGMTALPTANAGASGGLPTVDANNRIVGIQGTLNDFDDLPTAVAIRTEIDNNSTQLAAIVADTNELQLDWQNGGRLDLILDARASQSSVDGLQDISTADVLAQCQAAIDSRRLDELMNTSLGSQPAAGSLFADLTEDDAGTQRFTTNALENGPSGSGGDWTTTEKEHIRYRLGVDGGTSIPATNNPNLGVVQGNVVQLGGDAQSLTDLKDFADEGYNPADNKVQGVVLVDTVTTNTDMRGTDSANTTTPPTVVQIRTELDDNSVDLDAILARLPSALISGRMDSTVSAINDNANAAQNLAISAQVMITGAAIAGTLSTTQMSTNLTEATNDHYNGRIIVWTSGVLLGQATAITDYDGTSKVLTFTAVTEAPSADDSFIII